MDVRHPYVVPVGLVFPGSSAALDLLEEDGVGCPDELPRMGLRILHNFFQNYGADLGSLCVTSACDLAVTFHKLSEGQFIIL